MKRLFDGLENDWVTNKSTKYLATMQMYAEKFKTVSYKITGKFSSTLIIIFKINFNLTWLFNLKKNKLQFCNEKKL